MDAASQLTSFFLLMATGAVLAFIYDIYRVLRGVQQRRSILGNIGDLLYWFLATIIIAGSLLYNNGGELRIYVVLALIAGSATYFRWLSHFAIKALTVIFKSLTAVLRWTRLVIFYTIFKPLSYPLKLAIWPFALAARRIQAWKEKTQNTNPPPNQ